MANYNQISRGTSDSKSTMELQKLLNSKGNYNLVVDGKFGPATESALKAYQKANNLDVDGIAGPQTWGALTKAQNTTTTTPTATAPAQTDNKAHSFTYEAYKPSDAVTQAEALLQQQLAQKPGAYSSAWQTQLDDTLNKILNREKFSYDLNGDALYQQYKDQYTTQGKLAMMDTMGQAQAATGGYGNSYAQSVGQQAYQGYLQQLNDKVPELYQLALDQYNQEGQDLYNQYGLYADRDAQDYGRYRDSVSDYNADLARLAEDAIYKDSTEYGRWLDKTNLDYGIYRDNVADDQWGQSFQYQKEQDIIANDWKQKEYDLALDKVNASGGTNKSKDYKSLDVGSTAYNTIIGDIEAVETYDDLLSITKRYIALGYDPDEINELTAAKAKRLKPGDTVSARDALSNGLHGFSGTKYMLN